MCSKNFMKNREAGKILGQEKALERLESFYSKGSMPGAFLFLGPPGVGKKLTAFHLAKALNCSKSQEPRAKSEKGGFDFCGECENCASIEKGIHPDVRVLDAPEEAHIKIDPVRSLMQLMEKKPSLGLWKAAVISEAHTLTTEAANALLKALEEPSERTLWILISSQRHRMLPTVLSRCVPIVFKPLSLPAVEEILKGQASLLCGGSLERAKRLMEARSLDGSSLPRELAQARRQAGLLMDLWIARLEASFRENPTDGAASALKGLLELERAVQNNASPSLAVELAQMEIRDKG